METDNIQKGRVVEDPLTGTNEPTRVESSTEEPPTASHSLADESIMNETEKKGASQVEHKETEVRDLVWNKDASNVPRPVVAGLRNEDLWTLIRRFNMQTFHVRSIEEAPLANLDMNIAEDEEFSPDKLRAQLERLYVTVVVAVVSLWKHIVRLRSWKEYQRTSMFLSIYLVAWLLDILVPTFVAFLMVLAVFPRSRDVCFPPAPPALIDSKTGGVQKPPAGVLATSDTLTGAPERHEGEAVEQEAHGFVNSIASLAISTTAGKHPQGDPHDDSGTPDPTKLTEDVSDAKEQSQGKEPKKAHNKAKQPVSDVVWSKARPAMHSLADFLDTWERFGNALGPTPPFPTRKPRLILAVCLVPMFVGSYFTTPLMLIKGLEFGLGFVLFGGPVIDRFAQVLERTYPRWKKYTELRNSILKGIPTNAQLAITLLRIGERNKAPIPPVPGSDVEPVAEVDVDTVNNLDHLGATQGEILEAAQPTSDAQQADDEKKQEPKKGSRFLNALKGTAKGGINTMLTADKIKAAAGEHRAKDRRGVVRRTSPRPEVGPVEFRARYKGRMGYAYVTTTATTPAISWTANMDDMKPAWTVPIMDIDELKKVGGLGWKSKIVVAWALEKQIVDGLIVKTKQGEEYHLTAIMVRDELFNRLIAIGNQMWEEL